LPASQAYRGLLTGHVIISKVQKREYLTAETLRKTTHVFWHSLELNHGYI